MSSLAALEATLNGAAGADEIPSDFPVYITEFGVQSYPDPNAVRPRSSRPASSDRRALRLRGSACRDLRPVPAERRQPASRARPGYGGFESGLRFYDGRKKPSYDAFRLPLAVQRLGGTRLAVGTRAALPAPDDSRGSATRTRANRRSNLQTVDTEFGRRLHDHLRRLPGALVAGGLALAGRRQDLPQPLDPLLRVRSA